MQHGVRSATNILEDKKDEGFRKVNSGERVDVGAIQKHPDSSATEQQSTHPPAFEVEYLPDLPPFPARPALHISFEDIATYIQPLISHHWKISHVSPGVGEHEILSLDRRYNFKSFNDVMDFVQRVADISRAEKHHARIVVEYSTVDICLHTHTACCRRDGEGKAEFKKVPGLTRRDIRFALKVEELHEKFKKLGRAIHFVLPVLPYVQRRSMKSVLRRYGPNQSVVKREDVCSTSSSNETEI